MVKRKSTVLLDPRQVVKRLAARLAGDISDFVVGQSENISLLLDMVERTVKKGESNSLLVLGPRGVGKTTVVRKALCIASESPSWADNAVVVELNGSVQTDDKIALKDITKQLHLENVVGDKVFGSFAEHLSFLLASLKSGDSVASKPIIFILEEFDSFCSHKNQTLLYNLFDVAQSRAVPICVIGVSCQFDVTELLEKRVKSRFSHRHLYMMQLEQFSTYHHIAKEFLTLGNNDGVDGYEDWNKQVKILMEKKETKDFFEKVFLVDKSITYLKRMLYLSLLRMITIGSTSTLEMKHLETSVDNSYTHFDKTNASDLQVKDLSIVEICLLVAVKHINEIYDNEPFNFEMVFHEYLKFKRRKCSMLTEERSVVAKSWENLQELELVRVKTGERTRGQQQEYVLNTSHIPQDVVKKAVEKYSCCPTEVTQWLGSSVHASGH